MTTATMTEELEGVIVPPEADPDREEDAIADARESGGRRNRKRATSTPKMVRVRYRTNVVGVAGQGAVVMMTEADAREAIDRGFVEPATLQRHGAAIDLLVIGTWTHERIDSKGRTVRNSYRPGEHIQARVSDAAEIVRGGHAIPSSIFAAKDSLTFEIDEATGKWRASCEFEGRLFGQ